MKYILILCVLYALWQYSKKSAIKQKNKEEDKLKNTRVKI